MAEQSFYRSIFSSLFRRNLADHGNWSPSEESGSMSAIVEGVAPFAVPTAVETTLGERRPVKPDPNPEAARWPRLVDRIQSGETAAMEELYRLFARGVRFYIRRQLGLQEIEDKVHDTFVIVVQAIQRGELREPDRIMSFIRTVVRRQVANYISEAVHVRQEQLDLDYISEITDDNRTPEERVIFDQRVEMMKGLLRGISLRDREILTRFYILDQTMEEICEDMGISIDQFRLLKSRAKARFGAIGRRWFNKKNLTKESVMKKAASGH